MNGRSKLKGLLVAHFGAFLDQDWRVSDLLWGRLDGAERIITALLPYTPALRDQLIDEAHNEILREFAADERLREMALKQAVLANPASKLTNDNVKAVIGSVIPAPPPLSRAAHKNFMQAWMAMVPDRMNPKGMVEALARSTTITGRILEGIAEGKTLKPQAAWITNAGRAFWSVVELSVPRSAGTIIGRYWQALLLLIALLLIIAGLVSGQAPVSGVGWACFAIATALFVLRTALGSFMRGGNAWRGIRAVVVLLLVIVFAIGVWTTYEVIGNGWNWVQDKVVGMVMAGPSANK
jgi:Protein of unknown function (DUF3376)